MPVKSTPRATHADYQKLKDQATALKGEVTKLKKELAAEKSEANTLRTQLSVADKLVASLQAELADAKNRASQITQVADTLRKAAKPQVRRADQPVMLWEMAEFSQGTQFPNLAAAEAAKKDRPGYWYDQPGEAQTAWLHAQRENLADDTAEDDGQTPAEATT